MNKKKHLSNTIIINDCIRTISELTANDIITYMQTRPQEEKKAFASKVFEKSSQYNHFRAKSIFVKTYFPQAVEKENTPLISDTIKSWAIEEIK